MTTFCFGVYIVNKSMVSVTHYCITGILLISFLVFSLVLKKRIVIRQAFPCDCGQETLVVQTDHSITRTVEPCHKQNIVIYITFLIETSRKMKKDPEKVFSGTSSVPVQYGQKQNTRTSRNSLLQKSNKTWNQKRFRCSIHNLNIVSDSFKALDWKRIQQRNVTYIILQFVHLKINCATLWHWRCNIKIFFKCTHVWQVKRQPISGLRVHAIRKITSCEIQQPALQNKS